MEPFDTITVRDQISIPYKCDGVRCSLNIQSVPQMMRPQTVEMENPVQKLCPSFLKSSGPNIAKMTFPFIIDVFHQAVSNPVEYPKRCEKCNAFLPQESFTNGVPNVCPFCTKPIDCKPSYLRIPKVEKEKESIFIFVVIGNMHSLFYEYLSSFEHSFMLCSYTDHLTFCTKTKSGFKYLECFDCEVPLSIAMNKVSGIPMFPYTDIEESDLNVVINAVDEAIPDFGGIRNIVIVNELPHKCPTEFKLKNATFSMLSSNSMKCKCREFCSNNGGFFLAHHYALPAAMKEVMNIGIRCITASSDDNRLSLIAPGYYAVQNTLSIINKIENQPVQIIVELNDSYVVSTFPMKSIEGLHTLCRDIELPNFILSLKDTSVAGFAYDYNQTENCIELPSTLTYALHYKRFFGYNEAPRIISRVLPGRPFVLQIRPTVRVPRFVTDDLLSTLSVVLILYDNTIYLYVGGDVSRGEWKALLGVSPPDSLVSFEVYDTKADEQEIEESVLALQRTEERKKDFIEARNEMWKAIRILQSQFPSIYTPIIAIPSESGRRTEIVEIMRCDSSKGDNTLLRKFGDVARTIAGL